MTEFPLIITAWAAAILGLFYVWQTWRVISYRRAHGVVLGETEDRDFRKRIRGHANAAEQMPLGLILLGLNEATGPGWAALGLAVLLVGGRLCHGLYFGIHGLPHQMRVLGMLATLLAQGLGAIGLMLWLITL